MIQRRGLLTGAIAVLMLPKPSLATGGTVEDFRLGVNWSGLHVADLTLGYQLEGASIAGSMTIASRGMVSLLTSYHGQIRSTSHDRDGRLISAHYRAYYENRRYTRDIEISYDEDGNPADIVLLKRGKPQNVDIPRELWADTVDPLTAILRVRRWVATPKRSKEETIQVFDGRSRYDLNLSTLPAETDKARAKLVIQPIASASRSSWLKGWENEKGRWIDATFSNDARAVPILLETQESGTSSSIRLDQDCSNAAACS